MATKEQRAEFILVAAPLIPGRSLNAIHIAILWRAVAVQGDKYSNVLKGSPAKKGFKIAHVPPAPPNMDAQKPWEGNKTELIGTHPNIEDGMALGPTSVTKRITTAEKSKWIGGKDFDARGNKTRSAVVKPGFSDATTAAMHDSYYTDED